MIVEIDLLMHVSSTTWEFVIHSLNIEIYMGKIIAEPEIYY